MKAFEAEMGKQLRSTKFDKAYYDEHRAAGLDYLSFGGWQLRYGRWFVDVFGLKGKRVLDIGCACGMLMRGFGQAGAIVQGLDACEHMIRIGLDRYPDMAPIMFHGDAKDLSRWEGGTQDCLHLAQVAEHFKPEEVPDILKEFHRVLKVGGLVFSALDTTELYERQGRRVETEDPTHWCVKPMSWWYNQLDAAGFSVENWTERMNAHPQSLSRDHDWDIWVARKV